MHTRTPAAAEPQYALVARALIDDIERGRYPVGSLLPPELDLCTQFGVSRHTIREAIRRLQDYGLITRQRGVGTEVRADRVEPRYVQSTTSIADLLQYVEDTRLVMHASKDVIADAALAGLLACPPGQRWRQLSGHRYAGRGKLPIALTDVYINAAYSGIATLIGTQKVPVYRLIEATYGESVVEVQQTIRGVTIRTADARRLKVKPGSAGLLVTRRYVGKSRRVIEVAVNLHPGERFTYTMSLRLQSGRASAGDERHGH
ncbi:MAG TPA: GntR family transcriptional regulator [Burkholderiaceae bacterium]|nr:GntR family transcriptional regulator [Burkholderiaceae bacterium]HQR75796.1 GntR family transcriptional regulator [Burkholderiaceae bacterium]